MPPKYSMTLQTDSHLVPTAAKALKNPVCLAAIGMFLILAFLIYGHVFSMGVCCADDATNAIVAKNLAFGYGYSNSILFDGTPGLKLFDPAITTGPTLVLPTASLIYVVGNVAWAPGFVTATASLLLLFLVALGLWKYNSCSSVSAYLCLLMFLLYSVTAIEFLQWYSLVGEIPAALLAVLGAVLLASQPERRSAVAMSAFMYGLAFMTKTLALLCFVPVVLWLLARTGRPATRRQRSGDCFIGVLAFVAPMLGFELWKALSLGLPSYIRNLQESLTFFTTNSGTLGSGNVTAAWTAAWSKCLQAAGVMHHDFGYFPLAIVLVATAIAALIYRYAGSHNTRLLFGLLLAGALVNLAWWFFTSNGWARYALIGLFLYSAAISCVVFIEQPRTPAAGCCAPAYQRFVDRVSTTGWPSAIGNDV